MDPQSPKKTNLHPNTSKEAIPQVDLPFWARILMAAIKLIPGVPQWLILILPLVIAIIEELPLFEKRIAEEELYEVALKARKGDTKTLEAVAKKHWKRHCESGQILGTDLGASGVRVDPLPRKDEPTKVV